MAHYDNHHHESFFYVCIHFLVLCALLFEFEVPICCCRDYLILPTKVGYVGPLSLWLTHVSAISSSSSSYVSYDIELDQIFELQI